MSKDSNRRIVITALAKNGFVFVRYTYHGEMYRHPHTRTVFMVPGPGHMTEPRAFKNARAELQRLGIAI